MTPTSDVSKQQDVNVRIIYVDVLQIYHSKKNIIFKGGPEIEKNWGKRSEGMMMWTTIPFGKLMV